MLILRNYTISNNKEKITSATIEEGDDIAAITFFTVKPQQKGQFAISLQQSEEGGDSYRLLLQYKVPAFFAMLQGKDKLSKTKEEEGDDSNATVAFFFCFFCNTKKKKKATALLPSPSSSSFFLANIACGQTNKQKKQEKNKLDAYLGPALALVWVPHWL
jgi:hypothetical protein